MNLTMFCKKVNIPFEVYAFNNGRWQEASTKNKNAKPEYQDNDLSVDESFRMLNFISSRMNAKEYEQGMTNLYALGKSRHHSNYNYYGRRFRHQTAEQIEEENMWSHLPNSPQGYGLSSTPLNDTIMAAMKMVKEFQSKYGIDKMNTVFLTDGASDGNERVVCINPTEEQKKSRYANEEGGYFIQNLDYDTNHIMVDREMKHLNFNDNNRDDMTENLLKALKVKTGSKVIGFYISARRKIDRFTLDKYFPEWNRWSDKKKKLFNRREVMAKYRKDKVLVVKDNTGYDEYYLLAGDDLQVEDGLMATPSDNAKKGEIKKLFAQNLKSNRQSRVVMNRFISQVA